MDYSKEDAIELLLNMGDVLKDIALSLKGEGGAATSKEEGAQPQRDLTLEEVRAELSKLSKAGKTSLVKQMLAGVGAAKLSDVDPSKYWQLMAQAQEALGAAEAATNA